MRQCQANEEMCSRPAVQNTSNTKTVTSLSLPYLHWSAPEKTRSLSYPLFGNRSCSSIPPNRSPLRKFCRPHAVRFRDYGDIRLNAAKNVAESGTCKEWRPMSLLGNNRRNILNFTYLMLYNCSLSQKISLNKPNPLSSSQYFTSWSKTASWCTRFQIF